MAQLEQLNQLKEQDPQRRVRGEEAANPGPSGGSRAGATHFKCAPNVLIVLIDDAGFGCSSAFGGPCHTPTAERLAADG